MYLFFMWIWQYVTHNQVINKTLRLQDSKQKSTTDMLSEHKSRNIDVHKEYLNAKRRNI